MRVRLLCRLVASLLLCSWSMWSQQGYAQVITDVLPKPPTDYQRKVAELQEKFILVQKAQEEPLFYYEFFLDKEQREEQIRKFKQALEPSKRGPLTSLEDRKKLSALLGIYQELEQASALMTPWEKRAQAVEAELATLPMGYHNRLYTPIKELFFGWLQKDEFETSQAYERRIREKSKEKFDEICQSVIIDLHKRHIHATPAFGYDADRQVVIFTLSLTSSTAQLEAPCSIAEAKDIKDMWMSISNVSLGMSDGELTLARAQVNGHKVTDTTILGYERSPSVKIVAQAPNPSSLSPIKIPFDYLLIELEGTNGHEYVWSSQASQELWEHFAQENLNALE